MAFIRHLPCPKCLSRDNYGEFDNGFYCFGCGYRKLKTDNTSIRDRLENRVKEPKSGEMLATSKTLPIEAEKWLAQYGLTKEEKEGFGWNEENKLLVLINTECYYLGKTFT